VSDGNDGEREMAQVVLDHAGACDSAAP
jgi:hypothetical protein